MSRIKICGLTKMADILAVNQALPDYVGFVFAPSKRKVSPEQVRLLTAQLDKRILTVGVFVNQPEEMIVAYLKSGLIQIAQLHGQEEEAAVCRIKGETDMPVIKAVSVKTSEDIYQWQDSQADYLLFDHGKGGTGESFSWDFLKAEKALKKPFFLAGGINANNIAAALALNPYCVDVSSGAETNGSKDAEKINLLTAAVKQGRKGSQ